MPGTNVSAHVQQIGLRPQLEAPESGRNPRLKVSHHPKSLTTVDPTGSIARIAGRSAAVAGGFDPFSKDCQSTTIMISALVRAPPSLVNTPTAVVRTSPPPIRTPAAIVPVRHAVRRNPSPTPVAPMTRDQVPAPTAPAPYLNHGGLRARFDWPQIRSQRNRMRRARSSQSDHPSEG